MKERVNEILKCFFNLPQAFLIKTIGELVLMGPFLGCTYLQGGYNHMAKFKSRNSAADQSQKNCVYKDSIAANFLFLECTILF